MTTENYVSEVYDEAYAAAFAKFDELVARDFENVSYGELASLYLMMVTPAVRTDELQFPFFVALLEHCNNLGAADTSDFMTKLADDDYAVLLQENSPFDNVYALIEIQRDIFEHMLIPSIDAIVAAIKKQGPEAVFIEDLMLIQNFVSKETLRLTLEQCIAGEITREEPKATKPTGPQRSFDFDMEDEDELGLTAADFKGNPIPVGRRDDDEEEEDMLNLVGDGETDDWPQVPFVSIAPFQMQAEEFQAMAELIAELPGDAQTIRQLFQHYAQTLADDNEMMELETAGYTPKPESISDIIRCMEIQVEILETSSVQQVLSHFEDIPVMDSILEEHFELQYTRAVKIAFEFYAEHGVEVFEEYLAVFDKLNQIASLLGIRVANVDYVTREHHDAVEKESINFFREHRLLNAEEIEYANAKILYAMTGEAPTWPWPPVHLTRPGSVEVITIENDSDSQERYPFPQGQKP